MLQSENLGRKKKKNNTQHGLDNNQKRHTLFSLFSGTQIKLNYFKRSLTKEGQITAWPVVLEEIPIF